MSKWYSPKELKQARTPMLLDSVTGLPDNHVITVVERVISVDDPELIQNNVRTDTFTLNLDAEYDDLNVVVIFTKPNNINVKVAYNGTPTHIPGSAMELVGSLACSVVGIDADGEVRAVTKAAPDTFQVVKSGAYDGSVTSDDAELLGQILQAVSDAEAAIIEAETATTASTNATSQATSAATSANKAASSANSAASSANSAATRATSAAVNAENAYDTLQPYMATIDSCANILHREVGPDAVVTADDSFPCKPVEMVVYGNTVQNLWVNPSGTSNGVTVTSNEDGSLTIHSDGATANTYIYKRTYCLKQGSKYTVETDKAIPQKSVDAYIYIVGRNSSDSVSQTLWFGISGATTEHITINSDVVKTDFGVFVANGKSIDVTIRVMLNEGSTAEPWCPPGLNSVGQLREDEKNLWVNPSGTGGGITVTPQDDGTVAVSGTVTGYCDVYVANPVFKPNTNYTISVDKRLVGAESAGSVGFYVYNGTTTWYALSISGQSRTFTTTDDVSSMRVGFYVNNNISAVAGATISGTYKVMLNEGSTVKPWVPPESESCVRVVTAGKNLNRVSSSINDVSWAGIVAGSDEYNIWASKKRALLELFNSLPEGTYKLSGKCTVTEMYASGSTAEPSSSDLYGIIIRYSNNQANPAADRNNTGSAVYQGAVLKIDQTITISPETSMGMYNELYVYAPGKDSGFRSYADFTDLQLELGSTATSYEPLNIITTPIDLQGHTLNALPDGTRDELHIDGGGNVVLEKRTGVATAPESASSWVVESDTRRAYFTLSDSSSIYNDYQKSKLWCDKLPVRNAGFNLSKTEAYIFSEKAYAQSTQHETASEFVSAFGGAKYIYPLAEPQTIDLGTITPPTMAAPNVTAYVADDTPAEMELDYVRDINIVVDRLEKKVADLVVTEATYV